MANVKNRMNSPKSNSTKTYTNNGKEKKSVNVVGAKTDAHGGNVEVIKYHSKLKPQNSKCNNYELININQGTNSLTNYGHIRKKPKINVQLMDNILKSELLIKDSKDKHEKKKAPVSLGVNNNIYCDIKKLNNTKESNSCTADLHPLPLHKPKKPKDFSKRDGNKSHSRKRKHKDIELERNHQKLPKIVNKDVKKNDSICEKDSVSKEISKIKSVRFANDVPLDLALFQCDHCKRTFNNKSSLRRHMYVHMDFKPYTCKRCLRGFAQRNNLRVHMLKKHGSLYDIPEAYMCNQCDKTFLLKENLDLHLSTHVNTSSDTSIRCSYCDKKFSHNLLLAQHEKQHVNGKRFQCLLCSSNYDCRSQLALHVKSHLNIRDFVCQYCGKEFLRPNSIRRHVEICHGGHRIQCPICHKKLKGHLSEHLRTHRNSKPHECPDCGQRFTQSTQLNVHKRSHTGARPYPCRICNRPFSHSNALMLHIRRHTGEKPFPCAMCPMAFSQLPHMKAHMSKIHGKNDPYKCRKCNHFFKLKIHLEEHVKACCVEDRKSSNKNQESLEVDSVMSLSRMRFLLALLLTMIASKEKLKYLGFNKRLIDDLLIESLEAMGQQPCKDQSMTPLRRLKTNIQMLMNRTVPKDRMKKFKDENVSTEELLEILTGEKKRE